MIRNELIPEVDEKEYGEVYPRYGGQSLANVPHTVAEALGVAPFRSPIDKRLYRDCIGFEGIRKVVLVLLDGFGYNMWLAARNVPGFFNVISKKGIVVPITTVFPSTTAAAVTTVSTGLTPIEHGLPEWVVYMKEIGTIINTLPFTEFMAEERVDLAKRGVDPRILYDGTTVYQRLRKEGVKSITLTHREIMKSAYTSLIRKGADNEGFVYPTDAVIKLRRIIESEKGMAYINMYMANIDSSTHNFGPFSEESNAEIGAMSQALKVNLLDKVGRAAAKDTLIMVTADHGHTHIDIKKVMYMNRDRKVYGYLASDRGRKILPTGSPRGVFLHVKEQKTDEAVQYLQRKFHGVARVVRTEDAVRMGLFGAVKPHRKFMDRVGDVIILPKDHKAVWYEHIKGRKHHHIGVHGGLSMNEMVIPLAMARLSDLI